MSSLQKIELVVVNGRLYQTPSRPTVVICLDGCDPAYLDVGLDREELPAFALCRSQGFLGIAEAAMPTFTNPNNISIVTGLTPGGHGVSGNYYFDRDTNREVMVTGTELLAAPTILAGMAASGVRVGMVTAKDKLRLALGHKLPAGTVQASAERAGSATLAENGIAGLTEIVGRGQPNAYSADLSLFVLDAGRALLGGAEPPDLLYLSLSDYVQHSHAPDTPEARAFMREIDTRVASFVEVGCLVAVTADHGMSDMAGPDGTPRVAYLGDVLDNELGPAMARVICPITDPFVRHHGALGGFIRVHLPPEMAERAAAALRDLPAVEQVLTRAEACKRFDLPFGPEGDLAVVAAPGWALGSHAAAHRLDSLAGARLRSHGGTAERRVPFLLSRPLQSRWLEAHPALRNFDIFDAALNGAEP